MPCDSRVSFQRDTMWHFNALFQPAKSPICKTRSRSGHSFAISVRVISPSLSAPPRLLSRFPLFLVVLLLPLRAAPALPLVLLEPSLAAYFSFFFPCPCLPRFLSFRRRIGSREAYTGVALLPLLLLLLLAARVDGVRGSARYRRRSVPMFPVVRSQDHPEDAGRTAPRNKTRSHEIEPITKFDVEDDSAAIILPDP